MLRQVEINAQSAAVAQSPAGGDGLLAENTCAMGLAARQAWNDLGTAQLQQGAVVSAPVVHQCRVGGFPIRHRCQEGSRIIGVGNALASCVVVECAEVGKFPASTFAYRLAQF